MDSRILIKAMNALTDDERAEWRRQRSAEFDIAKRATNDIKNATALIRRLRKDRDNLRRDNDELTDANLQLQEDNRRLRAELTVLQTQLSAQNRLDVPR